jgi:hypothetical protein
MKRFVFFISSLLFAVYLCLGSALIDLKDLVASPEKFTGKNLSIEGVICRKCPKEKSRFFISSGKYRFGLIIPEHLNKTTLSLLKKDAQIFGKVCKASTPIKPEGCSKCSGTICGQYLTIPNNNSYFDQYYVEVESISEKM